MRTINQKKENNIVVENKKKGRGKEVREKGEVRGLVCEGT